MSDLIKVTHLKRETFKTMAAKQKLDHYGSWLKDQEFKDMTAAVQIRDDRDTMERLKPPMQEAFGENEFPSIECQVLRIVRPTYITSSKPACIIPIRTISATWHYGDSPTQLTELVVGQKAFFIERIWVEAGVDFVLARAI